MYNVSYLVYHYFVGHVFRWCRVGAMLLSQAGFPSYVLPDFSFSTSPCRALDCGFCLLYSIILFLTTHTFKSFLVKRGVRFGSLIRLQNLRFIFYDGI